MYHHHFPITPGPQATNGAPGIFAGGCLQHDVQLQLPGFSVLRSAVEAQVHSAMPHAQTSHRVTLAEIHAMLARS